MIYVHAFKHVQGNLVETKSREREREERGGRQTEVLERCEHKYTRAYTKKGYKRETTHKDIDTHW